MNADAASLDRLHDIVLPPPIPWWPPAPAWYVVLAIAIGISFALALRAWKRWRANAYRRAALRELATANSPSAISELLRRTALAVAPRSIVAVQTGADWPAWLAAKSPDPMPEQVRKQLTVGAYSRSDQPADVDDLRNYAARWIGHHLLTTRSTAERAS